MPQLKEIASVLMPSKPVDERKKKAEQEVRAYIENKPIHGIKPYAQHALASRIQHIVGSNTFDARIEKIDKQIRAKTPTMNHIKTVMSNNGISGYRIDKGEKQGMNTVVTVIMPSGSVLGKYKVFL